MKLTRFPPPARSRATRVRHPRARPGLRRRGQDRLHHRPVGPLRRHRRPGRRRGRSDGDRRHGRQVNGKKIELLGADHQNKPDIAASKAREWFDQQGVDMLIAGTNSGAALAMAKVAAEKKKPFIVGRRPAARPHQRAVHALHRPLRLRHRGAGEGHRPGGRQGGRQELVLPDRRLRLRHAAAGRRDQGRDGGRGQRRRLGAGAALGQRLLLVHAAGAGEQGADPRPRQRRRRHHQRGQGGQRVRPDQDDEAGRPADVHQRRALARPEGDAGHVPDRQLVLEPDAESRAWAKRFFEKRSGCRRRCRRPTTRSPSST